MTWRKNLAGKVQPNQLVPITTREEAEQFFAKNMSAPGNWTNEQVIDSQEFQAAIAAIRSEDMVAIKELVEALESLLDCVHLSDGPSQVLDAEKVLAKHQKETPS